MAHINHANESETNDVSLQFPGDRFPVVVGPNLRSSGWRGGLFVQYVTGDYDFTVEVSDGNATAGFLLFASENYDLSIQGGAFLGGDGVGSAANFISGQPATHVGGQNVVTMVSGGTRSMFKVYETVALNGAGNRAGGAITYTLGESLKISENGLLCNDSNVNLAAAGVATPIVVGIVSAVPSSANNNRLGVDLKY